MVLLLPYCRGIYLKRIFVLFLVGINSVLCSTSDPELEKAYLGQFSREFGFTLVGEKPVSIEELDNEYLELNPSVIPKFLNSLKEVFSRSSKFIFKVFDEDSSHFTAELIHKPSLKKLIIENQHLKNFINTNFRDELDFFNKLENKHIGIFDLLKRNSFIIGIVLGYGEANSEYCTRRSRIASYLYKYCFSFRFLYYVGPYFRWRSESSNQNIKTLLAIKKPEVSPPFNTLEEEWEWIKEVWWDLGDERTAKPPYFITLPHYVCRHGGDSEMIRDKYKRARIKLAALLCKNSIQEAIAMEALKK